MTKKLESLFNLPEMGDGAADPAVQQTIEENREIIRAVDSAIDKIDQALPFVNDLDTSDKELDDLSDLAKEKFQDLIDLGMNVEVRYASRIFEVASSMLGHSINEVMQKWKDD